VGSEISAFESEQYACAIVASPRSEMKGRGLLLPIWRIDHCSGFRQDAADLDVPIRCSVMEGPGLILIPCLDRCSCFRQYTTDFDVPSGCSEM
jgi:hypothetical protein